MITVLINAYACAPNRGSEPGMAWNWIVNLAMYCELYVITEGEWQAEIEVELSKLPQKDRIHFYYNPLSEKVRKICWNQGDWRFYYYYKQWQKKTLTIANEIIKANHIDIVHQLNMIGFREPGYLWQIKDKAFVWGPVDAKEKFPTAYLQDADWGTWFFIQLKNYLTIFQLRFAGRVRKATAGSIVVAASSNSQQTFKKYFGVNAPLINETGCYIRSHELIDKSSKKIIDVLWVGKLDFRKQLGIALGAVAASNNTNIKLHIVGSGSNELYVIQSATLGISEQCIWHGSVSHQEVQQIMQQCDLFLFTSVAEGTPHVVLEAISNNLPVLCFDTCGHGDSVNEKVGMKIPLVNSKQSVIDFSERLNYLYNNRQMLQTMSENCKLRQEELSWDMKVMQMVELYNKCVVKN